MGRTTYMNIKITKNKHLSSLGMTMDKSSEKIKIKNKTD